jgi:hypothetical protein
MRMRSYSITLLWSLLASLILIQDGLNGSEWTRDMQSGELDLRSAGSLAFGPEGILFVADSRSAAIHAIATADTTPVAFSKPLKLEALDRQLASMLGVPTEEVMVHDMAVNPISHNIYLSLSRGRGPQAAPVIVMVTPAGKISPLEMTTLQHSTALLPDAPVDKEVGEGRRRSNPRLESITDIAFLDGRVLVAGLVNEEFASTLRAIPFPFKQVSAGTKVEIYHGAHGRFETRSPVRTFVPFSIGDQPHLLAAYTCTPLVQFPVSALQPGAAIVGKTVAELGNRNRPLDMVVYHKDEKTFLLMANSSRGIMKIPAEGIEEASGIQEAVVDGATKGLDYQTVESWQGVDQLDLIDSRHAVLLVRADNGPLHLESRPLP